MADRKPLNVVVDRALWASALSDAIDWTESFLDSHTECEPGNRCEAYRKDAAKLARYRRAYDALQVRQPLNDALALAQPVPIQDLPGSDHLVLPGTSTEGGSS